MHNEGVQQRVDMVSFNFKPYNVNVKLPITTPFCSDEQSDDGYKLEVLHPQFLSSTRGAHLCQTRAKKIVNVMQCIVMLDVLQCCRVKVNNQHYVRAVICF